MVLLPIGAASLAAGSGARGPLSCLLLAAHWHFEVNHAGRLRRLLAVLDGTPTGTRGQSLVELTLTLPITGHADGPDRIGWYANNY